MQSTRQQIIKNIHNMNFEVAIKLIKETLNPNEIETRSNDYEKASLLEIACRAGEPDLVQALLDKGAKINEPNPQTGFYPLHEVVYEGTTLTQSQIEKRRLILALFAEYNANDNNEEEKENIFNVTDNTKRTALMMCCTRNHLDFVNDLCSYGANINQKDIQSTTFYDYYIAKFGDSPAAQAYLANLKAKSGIEGYAYSNKYHATHSINMQDVNQETPLMLALRLRQPGIIDLLLKKKHEQSFQDLHGDTYLHLALKHGAPLDAIRTLLRQSANLETRNHEGQSPIDIAAKNGRVMELWGDKDIQAIISANFPKIARFAKETFTAPEKETRLDKPAIVSSPLALFAKAPATKADSATKPIDQHPVFKSLDMAIKKNKGNEMDKKDSTMFNMILSKATPDILMALQERHPAMATFYAQAIDKKLAELRPTHSSLNASFKG